jgi:lipoate-protein ligase A
MAMTIMHQTAHEQGDVSPQLEREWRLFQRFEAGAPGHGCMTWESKQAVVVLGRNSRPGDHVIIEACFEDGVPILRRCSGGGAVVLAPGCLNYAIGLSLVSYPSLIDVGHSMEVILGRMAEAVAITGLRIAGDADLALDNRKVSGNAQRRGRRALLHHGTLLYAFDRTLARRYLREPARQPGYRGRRFHTDFIGNLPLSKDALEAAVSMAWRDLDTRFGARS